MKKLFLIAGLVSMLTACGGGGGGGDQDTAGAGTSTAGTGTSTAGTGTNAVTCTKPKEQGPDLNMSGSVSTTEYSAMPTLQNITVSGSAGTIKFKACSFVKKLTITGDANEIEFDASSDVEEVVFEVNSGANSVNLNKASTATVLDLGNVNTLTRKN